MAVVIDYGLSAQWTKSEGFLLLIGCLASATMLAWFIFASAMCALCCPSKNKKAKDGGLDHEGKNPTEAAGPESKEAEAAPAPKEEPQETNTIPALLQPGAPVQKTTLDQPEKPHYFEVDQSQLKAGAASQHRIPPPEADVLETDQRYQTMVDITSNFEASTANVKQGNVHGTEALAGGVDMLSARPKPPVATGGRPAVSMAPHPTTAPKAVVPSMAPRVPTPSMAPRAGTPSMAPPVGTRSVAPRAGTPSMAPRAATPSMAPRATTPSMAPRPGVPSMAPAAGIPSMAPRAGIPSMAPRAGTPSMAPRAGVPSMAPRAGIPSMAPRAGVPSMAPRAGIPSMAPRAGVPSMAPRAGIPSMAPRAGVQSMAPRAHTPRSPLVAGAAHNGHQKNKKPKMRHGRVVGAAKNKLTSPNRPTKTAAVHAPDQPVDAGRPIAAANTKPRVVQSHLV